MTFDPSATGKFITSNHVLTMRRDVFSDGIVDRREVLALFALGNANPDGDDAWQEFFVEALCDFFLREERPTGYLTQEEFDFIKTEMLSGDKTINTLELQVLIGLQKRATQTPAEMTSLMLDSFKRYITAKTPMPFIDETDTALIKASLYSLGGQSATGISKEEASFIFDMNGLVENGTNAPEWYELFNKAIAAHLMYHCGFTPPPREEALRLEAWLEESSRTTIGGFISRMFDFDKMRTKVQSTDEVFAEHNRQKAAMIEVAQEITVDESNWLWRRICDDDKVSESELGLLRYLKHDVGAILPENVSKLIA